MHACSVVSNYSATPWTVAPQAPLSMGFYRQEYWSGLPFPPPGDLPDPGIESASPALAGEFFTTEPPGKPSAFSVWHFPNTNHPHGEGNDTPLQYSCLENPMDAGAWWAAVHGVTKSRTRLSNLTSLSLLCIGEGNGNPLQCSCLENPRDGGAWWAAIYGVAESDTIEVT